MPTGERQGDVLRVLGIPAVFTVLCLLIVLLTGIDARSEMNPDNESIQETVTTDSVVPEKGPLSGPGPSKPQAAQDASALAGGNNRFGVDLYSRLKVNNGNIAFSPYSISSSLTMASEGARGRTLKEMTDVMKLPPARETVRKSFSRLRSDISSTAKGSKLVTAGSLWIQQGYSCRMEFIDALQLFYGSDFFEVDFARSPEKARRKVNTWVDAKTGRMIPELFGQGMVKNDTAIIIADAVYFAGLWASQFNPELTRDRSFTVPAKGRKNVLFMHQEASFRTVSVRGARLIEMPYASEKISMIIVLPDTADGLQALEKSMSGKELALWTGKLSQSSPAMVALALPRFTVSSSFELGKTLSAMGMKSAFSPGADFSGITSQKGLFISSVIHKARIEVKEDGTKAAAATGIVMTKSVPRTIRFEVDRPFIFIIRDNATGQHLFLGRVTDPAA